ncbi:hypothetical protein ACI797_03060 [Geodermatophilus sp. SYSU D00691]
MGRGRAIAARDSGTQVDGTRSATLRAGWRTRAAALVGALTAAVVLVLPGTAAATPGYTPGHGDVVPLLSCVTPDGRGGFTAWFGHENTGTATEHVSPGPANRISPSRYDGDQPTKFKSGTFHRVFPVTVSSGSVSWTLDGDTVTADASSSPRCTTSTPTPTPAPTPAPDTGEVVPIVDCIEQEDDREYTAVLGYASTHRNTVTIPLGADNTVLLARDRQPTSFAPGTHHGVVSVRITFVGALWVLDGNAVYVAPGRAPACPDETQMPAEGNDTAPALALAGAAVVGALLVRRARTRLAGGRTSSEQEDGNA